MDGGRRIERGLTVHDRPTARADDDHAKCQHRIEKAEARLDQAIRSHGEHSSEAESRRRDLNAERERCWNSYHGWWSNADHTWHTERDWTVIATTIMIAMTVTTMTTTRVVAEGQRARPVRDARVG